MKIPLKNFSSSSVISWETSKSNSQLHVKDFHLEVREQYQVPIRIKDERSIRSGSVPFEPTAVFLTVYLPEFEQRSPKV